MNVSKIKVLSAELIHRIAAGEVIESPAAAMKELIENSVDAGASKISVLIVEGGLKLIEIRDNGAGMSRADLENCCQRHATSKIQDLNDLDNIHSLGFRGEALAALSAVSNLEILSRERNASEAWILKRHGANFDTQPTSLNEGTILRVQDLFFNTPARKKFLKSTASEASNCVRIFKELAVAHPHLELSLHILDESGEVEEDFSFPKQSREQRLASVLQKPSEYFFSISHTSPLVRGLKSLDLMFMRPPHVGRNSRDIFFNVNGRPVEDKRLAYVLREAFAGLIETGSFPRGLVALEVESSEVDVNVHPQKKEVRWSKEFPLHSIIFEECKRALQQIIKPVTVISAAVDSAPVSEDHEILLNNFYSVGVPSPKADSVDRTLVPTPPSVKFSKLRVVGEVGAAWLVCESEGGIVLIDQHAAHERVSFDKILKGRDVFSATPLLLPLKIDLPLAMKGQEEKILNLLEDWSFEGKVADDLKLEFFAVPKSPRKISWNDVFDEIFERIDQKQSVDSLREKLRVWISSSLACHGSVRRGQRLTNSEISGLLQSMDNVDWKEFCPHGRPTWIELSHARLEEEFHRS
jgi:DNA mismatch repair protein MutL